MGVANCDYPLFLIFWSYEFEVNHICFAMLLENMKCLVKFSLNNPSLFTDCSGSVILFDETIQFIGKATSRFPRWTTKE